MGTLSTSQAAKILNVNASRVRQLIAALRLKATKKDTQRGPVWRVDAASVAAFRRLPRGPKAKQTA